MQPAGVDLELAHRGLADVAPVDADLELDRRGDRQKALAAGDLLDAGGEVLLGVVDHVRRAVVERQPALGRRTGGADQLQPQRLGPLAGDQPDAAGRGVEHDVVAGLQALEGQLAEVLALEDIDESRLGAALSLSDLPEPDLFIRTGGEQRVSNFMLWQLAYTELYFTDTLWPDFDAAALEDAFASYRARERRFGRTSEQLEEAKRAQSTATGALA